VGERLQLVAVGRHIRVDWEVGIAVVEGRKHCIVVEQVVVGNWKGRHCKGRLGSREKHYKQSLVAGQLGNHKQK